MNEFQQSNLYCGTMRLKKLFNAVVHIASLLHQQATPTNEGLQSPPSTPHYNESQLPSTSPSTSPSPTPWSIRMAESVIRQSPDLVLYNGAAKVKWKYDFAMLGIVISKLDDGSQNTKFYKYAKDFMDDLVLSDGTMIKYDMSAYNLDFVQPAKMLVLLYQDTGEPQYLSSIKTVARQLEDQPRTESGGYFHKLRYPYQMWLDGIYMSSPFMAQYAEAFGEEKWYDEAVFQMTHIYEKTRDEDTGLIFHAWQETREEEWSDPVTGQSPSFWGRAMGWYLMGLVDSLDFIPKDHEGRDELIAILKDTTAALKTVRDEEYHLWYQVLDQGGRKGNYLEASASAMYTYTFAKAAKKGYIGAKYYVYAMESFDAMLDQFITVEGDGGEEIITLNNVASGIGLGLGGGIYRDGSFEYYTGVEIVDNDAKGVGPFILAAIELGR